MHNYFSLLLFIWLFYSLCCSSYFSGKEYLYIFSYSKLETLVTSLSTDDQLSSEDDKCYLYFCLLNQCILLKYLKYSNFN